MSQQNDGSNTSKRIVQAYETTKAANGTKPFTLVINYPGGRAPVQIYKAEPIRKVDKKP